MFCDFYCDIAIALISHHYQYILLQLQPNIRLEYSLKRNISRTSGREVEKRSCRQGQLNTVGRETHRNYKFKVRLSETFTIYLQIGFNLISCLQKSNVHICNNN